MTHGDRRPATTWRVTTSAGHQLHAVEWAAATDGDAGPDRAVDVLLVHGLASNARLWDGVGAALASHGHRVVAYDQRAHGHSERAADGFSWEGVVADLAEVVAALALDRPVAVGQSWGGNVVLEAAARAPGSVRGVMTVDGGFIDLQARFEDADAAWEALEPPSFHSRRYEDVAELMAERLEHWPPAALAGQLANITRSPDGLARPALRRVDHEQVVRRLWEHRPAATAAAVRLPVLLGACRGGGTTGPSDRDDAVAAVADRLSSGRVHWFEHADHDVHAQRPADVVAVLRGAIADGFLDPPADA